MAQSSGLFRGDPGFIQSCNLCYSYDASGLRGIRARNLIKRRNLWEG